MGKVPKQIPPRRSKRLAARSTAAMKVGGKSARIDRAAARAILRGGAPKMGVVTTSFGRANLRKGWGAGGFASTSKKNFPRSTKASTTDMSWSQLIGKSSNSVLKATIHESYRLSSGNKKRRMKPPIKLSSPDERRLASGIMGVHQSETQRHRAAPKAFRGAMREVIKEKKSSLRHKAATNAWPQLLPASQSIKLGYQTGAHAMDKPTNNNALGRRQKKSRTIISGYLSDSSDEED